MSGGLLEEWNWKSKRSRRLGEWEKHILTILNSSLSRNHRASSQAGNSSRSNCRGGGCGGARRGGAADAEGGGGGIGAELEAAGDRSFVEVGVWGCSGGGQESEEGEGEEA